jgi:hypothetical protein
MNATRSLAIERVVVAAGLIAALILFSTGARTLSNGRVGDFPAFYEAAQAVATGGDLYAAGQRGYIYPPLLAFVFRPLTAFSLHGAACVWLPINVALLFSCTLLASAEAVRRFGAPPVRRAVLLIASLALLLTVDKMRSSINQAQTDSLVLLGFVLGLRWLERRPAMAGVAIGFAANIKYLSLIALPYLIVRRRWKAAGWTIAGTVAWALLPAVSMGWSANLAALRKAGSGLLGALGVPGQDADAANVQGIDWHLSVSIASAVSRAFGPEAPLELKGAVLAVIGLAVLGLAWGIYAARGQPLLLRPVPEPDEAASARIVALEWAGLLVASLAFGPQTTGRHLVILVPVHAMGAAILLGRHHGSRKLPLLIAVIAFQLAMVLPPGGPRFLAATDAWRAVGGASWCLLAVFLAMLWAALPAGRATSLAARAGAFPP